MNRNKWIGTADKWLALAALAVLVASAGDISWVQGPSVQSPITTYLSTTPIGPPPLPDSNLVYQIPPLPGRLLANTMRAPKRARMPATPPQAPAFVNWGQQGDKNVRLEWTTDRLDVQAFHVMRLDETTQTYQSYTLGMTMMHGPRSSTVKNRDVLVSWEWVDFVEDPGIYAYAVTALYYDADSPWTRSVRVLVQPHPPQQ